ncbi:hypothetical protein ACFT2C_06135 [Promicromonospora sp. NPDC057138]|uniref:hypothetical protein n=1 Tax=Promicromonospora sp. NPDC057138 TaxID=3346031 RepID=UPI00362547B1
MTTTGYLVRHGRMPWAQARTLFDDTVGTWADLDGLHAAEPPPDDAPLTTHLWAWADDICWRLRFDGNETLVAALHLDAIDGDIVPVRVRDGFPWGRNDAQAGSLSDAAYALKFELLEVTGAAPVTFVRRKSTSP